MESADALEDLQGDAEQDDADLEDGPGARVVGAGEDGRDGRTGPRHRPTRLQCGSDGLEGLAGLPAILPWPQRTV